MPEDGSPSLSEALRVIERLGGSAAPPSPQSAEKVAVVVLRNTEAADADLRALAILTGLHHLDLSGTRISDAGLKHLAGLKRLHSLKLKGTSITGAGLKHLTGLEALSYLDVTDTKVRESDLVQLVALRKLQTVVPFGQKTTKAWLTPGKLKATDWVTSKDGRLSLRLLTPETPDCPPDAFVVLAELRNDSKESFRVIRPLTYFKAPGQFELVGPDGRLYAGPKVENLRDMAVPGGAIVELPAGQTIRDHIYLGWAAFHVGDLPAEYRVTYTYAPPRLYAEGDLWHGRLRSKPATVVKVPQPAPTD